MTDDTHWAYITFSRAFAERVVGYLENYGSKHGFTEQLRTDIGELEGALMEQRIDLPATEPAEAWSSTNLAPQK